MLKAKLAQEMKNKRLSTHQAAREIGTSHTTILRALRGEAVDMATILKLGEWMGVKPATLVNSLPDAKAALPDQIAVMLGKHPSLEKEFAQAVKKILNGEVDASVIEDIAAYAAYKINLSASRQ